MDTQANSLHAKPDQGAHPVYPTPPMSSESDPLSKSVSWETGTAEATHQLVGKVGPPSHKRKRKRKLADLSDPGTSVPLTKIGPPSRKPRSSQSGPPNLASTSRRAPHEPKGGIPPQHEHPSKPFSTLGAAIPPAERELVHSILSRNGYSLSDFYALSVKVGPPKHRHLSQLGPEPRAAKPTSTDVPLTKIGPPTHRRISQPRPTVEPTQEGSLAARTKVSAPTIALGSSVAAPHNVPFTKTGPPTRKPKSTPSSTSDTFETAVPPTKIGVPSRKAESHSASQTVSGQTSVPLIKVGPPRSKRVPSTKIAPPIGTEREEESEVLMMLGRGPRSQPPTERLKTHSASIGLQTIGPAQDQGVPSSSSPPPMRATSSLRSRER